LTVLYLYRNQIVDIGGLGGLTNLTELVISKNQIVDLSVLSGLTNLTNLYLASNQIVDINPLVINTGIGLGDYVNLLGNPLECDDPDITTLLSENVDLVIEECNDQCYLPYTDLTLADRNQTFNDGTGAIDYCDQVGNADKSPQWQGPGWYRFSGSAGTRLPEVAPSTYSCGTDAPGWLNGTHPLPEDGVVDRTVCFSFLSNTCWRSSAIQVVNCNGYYRYNLLDTPDCDARYCGTD
jgi:Leucine-rich repeat (LRR) protein